MRKIVDYYSLRAKQENYAARSVFKLIEIDQKYHLIKKGKNILDIGCSPGSWSQYILKKIGNGKIFGIDISNKIKIKDTRFNFLIGDIFKLNFEDLKKHIGTVDLIVSDIAPNTSGDKLSDSQKSLRMLERVFYIAEILLKHNGNVAAKIFQGEDLEDYVRNHLKKNYNNIFHFKPKSSRKKSREIYIIAIGKKREKFDEK